MRVLIKLCLIPVALLEAVFAGCVYAALCFWDFWTDGHFPFQDKV